VREKKPLRCDSCLTAGKRHPMFATN